MPIQSVYFSYNGVAWYLTLTVFFLAAAPLVGKFTKNIKPIAWAAINAGVIMVEFLWCLLVQNVTVGHWLVYICPIVRLMDFILGYGTYQMTKKLQTALVDSGKRSRYTCISLLFAMAACIVFVALSMNFDSRLFCVAVWGLPVLAIIMSAALGANKVSLVRWVFENPLIVFMGNISLEFFLLHQLAIRYCRKIASYIGIEESVVFGIGIGLLSIAAAWIYQKMVAVIKKKYFGARRSS